MRETSPRAGPAPRRRGQAPLIALDPELFRDLVAAALGEDHAAGDITTKALVATDQPGRAVITAQAEGVLAGLPLAQAAFGQLDPELRERGQPEASAAGP